jgi:hypothetical protein
MLVAMWKQIPFAPKYLASDFGEILGLRGRLLNPSENHRGYLVLGLHKIQYRVNRIICTTFNGPPPTPEHHAAHKDYNKWNNRADNLYWATPQQNADDLVASGENKGVNHWHAAFTEAEVRYIRSEYDKGYSVAEIHKEFPNYTNATISHIARRVSYKDII